jgi:methanogenic corrinoid protein MtbC1
VSQAFADEIGADGYAKDSTLAVVKAKALLGATAVTS